MTSVDLHRFSAISLHVVGPAGRCPRPAHADWLHTAMAADDLLERRRLLGADDGDLDGGEINGDEASHLDVRADNHAPRTATDLS